MLQFIKYGKYTIVYRYLPTLLYVCLKSVQILNKVITFAGALLQSASEKLSDIESAVQRRMDSKSIVKIKPKYTKIRKRRG